MVKFTLQIKATLENIEKLYTCHPDYVWSVKICCSSCGEVSPKFCTLVESDPVQLPHNRSSTHLLVKCKLCSRENSIDILEGSNGVYTFDDAGKFKSIVTFDCRGLQLAEFEPGEGWIVQGVDNGKKFEDVDLSEREWVEYDDKNNKSVGVYDLEWQFVKVK